MTFLKTRGRSKMQATLKTNKDLFAQVLVELTTKNDGYYTRHNTRYGLQLLVGNIWVSANEENPPDGEIVGAGWITCGDNSFYLTADGMIYIDGRRHGIPWPIALLGEHMSYEMMSRSSEAPWIYDVSEDNDGTMPIFGEGLLT